ncbi:hypothetical protein N0V83_007474 [Neocucurbitaria cava]|uniref:Protein kinase domain-containing protein n=1 Tax=Neocucurbitaria cava TaxID=798079 RepID=A0A9W8Y5Y4_9PLEO|nr:hypothetical protein N0V83_007474 [Neocucurbitaria cava]
MASIRGTGWGASDGTLRKEPPLTLISHHIRESTKRALFHDKTLDGIWYAETKMPTGLEQNADPWRWNTQPRKINMQHILPKFDASSMTLAAPTGSVYEKKIDLLREGDNLFGYPTIKAVTTREIETCEVLRKYPHPNVCSYHGVTVDKEGLVSSLIFDRYDTNLHDMVDEHRLFNAEKCLTDVQRGLAHLHSLAFVHCDVKPLNIFVNVQAQQFVIGDFDSVHLEYARLDMKCGTIGWVPEDEDTNGLAKREIDTYAFDMVRAWLEAKGYGRSIPGLNYPQTSYIQEAARKAWMEKVRGPDVQDEDDMDVSW